MRASKYCSTAPIIISALLCGCGDGGVADTFVCATDTGETGSNDGCLFVPNCVDGEDEGATEILDLGSFADLGCNPDCPPPPGFDPAQLPFASWRYDLASDTYYRYASELEREVHGWADHTIVFTAATGVTAMTNGVRSLILGVPIGDGQGGIELASIALTKAQTRSDAWYLGVEHNAGQPLVHAFRPEFYLYLPSWVDLEALSLLPDTDLFTWAFGDSHGGVALQGLTPDQEFSIIGPSTGVWLETLPPDNSGVLVVTPEFHDTKLNDILDHWVEVLSLHCEEVDCELAPSVPLDPGSCGDCIDNDVDGDIDTNDLFCKHRTDFGCDNRSPHNHRWENSKDFAILPDIRWCTGALEDEMPWHAEINMKAMSAATLLNSISAELEWMHDQGLELAVDVPDNLTTIRYRMAYCVFAEDVAVADACLDDEQNCPANYKLGGMGNIVSVDDNNDDELNDYADKLWQEYDQAMVTLEAEGMTPKPVAMLSSVYSGNLHELGSTVIGISVSVGDLGWVENPYGLGTSVIEADYFVWANIAHEFGHALGLSHTDENGAPVNSNGFMQRTYPFPLRGLLGPTLLMGDGYGAANQWSNWAYRIGDKTIPRPQGFRWTGCNNDNDCPSQLECWHFQAMTPGVCRWPL